MPKQYQVIALSVGGAYNKIFNSGDIVLDSQFVPGRAEELVKQGFLKPIDAPELPDIGNDEERGFAQPPEPAVSNKKRARRAK